MPLRPRQPRIADAGALDQRVTIQNQSTAVQGREVNPEWTGTTQLWANIRRSPAQDEEYTEGGGLTTRAAFRVVVRRNSVSLAITTKSRLVWGTVKMYVRAIDFDTRQREGFVEIVAVRSDDQV